MPLRSLTDADSSLRLRLNRLDAEPAL